MSWNSAKHKTLLCNLSVQQMYWNESRLKEEGREVGIGGLPCFSTTGSTLEAEASRGAERHPRAPRCAAPRTKEYFSFCKPWYVPSTLHMRRQFPGLASLWLTNNWWLCCAIYISRGWAAAPRLSLPLPQVYSWLTMWMAWSGGNIILYCVLQQNKFILCSRKSKLYCILVQNGSDLLYFDAKRETLFPF